MGNRYYYFLLLFIILLSCTNQSTNTDNISEVNENFLFVIDSFERNTMKYSNNKNELISVSVIIDKNDTMIGLYSNLMLKNNYFIGKYKYKSIPIYFYSNYKHSIYNFYNVNEELVSTDDFISNESEDNIDTYTEFYYFRKGIFIQPKVY